MATHITATGRQIEIKWDDQGGFFECPLCGSEDTLFAASRDQHVGGTLTAYPEVFHCWHCDWEETE